MDLLLCHGLRSRDNPRTISDTDFARFKALMPGSIPGTVLFRCRFNRIVRDSRSIFLDNEQKTVKAQIELRVS